MCPELGLAAAPSRSPASCVHLTVVHPYLIPLLLRVAVVQAVSQILKGIATATAAHLSTRAKQRNISFAHQSVATISANRQAEGLPITRNSMVREPRYLPQASQQSPAPGATASTSGSRQGPRKSKSLAVRWGNDTDDGSNANGNGSGMAAGYNTTPATPVGRKAGSTANVWGDDGEAPDQQLPTAAAQPQASLPGSFSGAESSQAGSNSSQVGSFGSNGDDADFEGSGDGFFLPAAASQGSGRTSSSGGGSGGRRGNIAGGSTGSTAGSACIGAAGADAHMALASLSGGGFGSSGGGGASSSGGGASTQHRRTGSSVGGSLYQKGPAEHQGHHSMPGSSADSMAAAVRDPAEDELQGEPYDNEARVCSQPGGLCNTRASLAGAAAAPGCSGACEPTIYSVMSELDLSENPLGLTGAKAVAQVGFMTGFVSACKNLSMQVWGCVHEQHSSSRWVIALGKADVTAADCFQQKFCFGVNMLCCCCCFSWSP